MQETVIEVSSFVETNELLEELGFSYSSYQEKRREKYILNEHEIDIHRWPKLSPYTEIEGRDKNEIENMENPDAGQNNPPHRHPAHHQEAHRHRQRYHVHNP